MALWSEPSPDPPVVYDGLDPDDAEVERVGILASVLVGLLAGVALLAVLSVIAWWLR